MKNNLPTQKENQSSDLTRVKSSKFELANRIKYTLELMMNDYGFNDVIKILTEKYSVCSKQARRYIYMAHASLEEKNQIDQNRKVAWYKARKIRLIRDMDPAEKKTAQGVQVINKVINEIATMDGVVTRVIEVRGNREAPIAHEHKHAHIHQVPEIDYKSLPTEMLEQLYLQSKTVQQLPTPDQ